MLLTEIYVQAQFYQQELEYCISKYLISYVQLSL